MKAVMNTMYIIGVILVCTGVAFVAMASATPRAHAVVAMALLIMVRLVMGKEVEIEAERA